MSEKILTFGKVGPVENVRRVVAYLAGRSKVVDSIDFSELREFYKGTAGICLMARKLEKSGVIRRSFKSVRHGKNVTRAGIMHFDNKPRLIAALAELDEEIERRGVVYGPKIDRRAMRLMAKDEIAANLDLIIAAFTKPPQKRATHG